MNGAAKTEAMQGMTGVRLAIYLIHPAEDESAAASYRGLVASAASLPGAHMVKVISASALNPEVLAREIGKVKINGVVLVSEHPGFFKAAFARALELSGADGSRVQLVSVEAGVKDDAERVRKAVATAVQPARAEIAASPAKDASAFHPATLVIGAGVAGIQAALEIAESGNKVYLVERTGTIGGRMAMFDKTFPTLDCAACILTPKMVAVGQNPNIELMVLSEVQEVRGEAGAFKVKVLKHATRVDAAACVACGDCAHFCPVTTASEFDMGIASRKAIFIPFPQAVPNAYMVDAAHCTWIASGGKKCGACVKKCSKGAVHLDAQDQQVEIEVGNIIVATGYETLDATRIARYGYGRFPNVLTSLEFERLTNASGPTGGKIVLKTKVLNKRTKTEEWVFQPDGPKPKSVAILHCVGSRDKNFNPYCSRVCCMYSLKFAHLVREKLPEAKCHEYYIDMRAFGKGYEEFHERIREEGVSLIRGRSAAVREIDSQLYIHGEDTIAEHLVDVPVDMVILSVGLQPSSGCAELAATLDIPRDADGWFQEADCNAEPNSTGRDGIYLAGVCQGPKDIPDTVAQASAAAAQALRSLARKP
jgi:heterodisulfide reductase subunit A